MNPELLNVRQRYQQWTLAQLTELVEQTLEQRDDPVDQAWRTWLTNYCLNELRPRTLDATIKDWSRWLAFVLRYIQPLAMSLPPMETKPMIEVMRRRAEIIRVLMFGTHDEILQGLQLAYEIHGDYRARLPSLHLHPEQQDLFDKVMEDVKVADTRTVTGWSRFYLDSKREFLARQVYEALHAQSTAALPNIIQIVAESRHHQTISGRKFEEYLNLTLQQNGGLQLSGQALGYLNEFERRSKLTVSYSKGFTWTAGALLVFFILGTVAAKVPLGFVGSLAAAIFFAIGLLDVLVIAVILTVMVISIVDNYTWSNASLRTLEMLLGSMELDEDNSTSNLQRGGKNAVPETDAAPQ